MSAQFVTSFEARRQALDLKNKRLGLLLWRIANGGVFMFFIFANYLMRRVQTSWPPEGIERVDSTLPVIVSVLLLVSGIFASRAQWAIRRGDHAGMRTNLLITLGLGAAFLIGLLIACLQVPYSGSYSSIVMAMNGFHMFHALIGMLLFGYVLSKATQYTKENHWGVEAAVVFWHFVDLMWVFFFVVIYML